MPSKGEELLKYVHHEKVQEATAALVDGADQNFQDPVSGNTALHLAVSIKNETLVKLMIVFDADLTIKNYQDKTALDLAEEVGATVIAKDIKTILDLERELNADEPKVTQSGERNPDEALLLSLDGGGIRGLVFIQAMIEMEKRREKRYPGSKSLLSQFNWLTGNSAGGISVLALAGPDVDAKRGRKLFFELKNEVLAGEPPFPDEQVDRYFQKVYKDIYGKPSAMMSDIKDRKVSVMTTLCKECPPQLHIISNYGGVRIKGTEPPEKQLIWKAARATSAVPVIFHPQDHVYVDGGIMANNPTVDGMDYSKKESIDLKLKLVLSLGCGLNVPKAIDDVDFAPSRLGKVAAKVADFLGKHRIGENIDELLTVVKNPKAFVDLFEIILAQITQPNGQVLRRAEFLCEEVGTQYYRINPTISDINFLTTDDTQLIKMLYSVIKYMLENCRQQTDPVLDYIYGQ